MRKKCIVLLIVALGFSISTYAQQMSKSKFDELWNKADSTAKYYQKITIDLNKSEKDKIEAVEIKSSPDVNLPAKKITDEPTKGFSNKPIVNGKSLDTDSKVKPKSNTAELPKTKVQEPDKSKEVIIVQPQESIKTPVKQPEPAKQPITKQPETKPAKQIEVVTPKKTTVNEDFSTQPVIKGKTNTPAPSIDNKPTPIATQSQIINNKIDTTKKLKDFSFETTPVTNSNASYIRKDEPKPKTKEQREAAIPVNKNLNDPYTEQEKSLALAAYRKYDNEADSLQHITQKKMDSIIEIMRLKIPTIVNPNDFIDIYVNGGGVVSGINSKQYDHVSILHTGVIQREFKTQKNGTQRVEKKISKDELVKLAQYISDMGFFNFEDDYDCADNNMICNQRLKRLPQVVPLELTVTIGQQRNKVSVSIFAPTIEKNMVNYPENLEKIMSAIYSIIEK